MWLAAWRTVKLRLMFSLSEYLFIFDLTQTKFSPFPRQFPFLLLMWWRNITPNITTDSAKESAKFCYLYKFICDFPPSTLHIFIISFFNCVERKEGEGKKSLYTVYLFSFNFSTTIFFLPGAVVCWFGSPFSP